jgi:hypothetical protein
VLRAGRSTAFGVHVAPIAVLAILMICCFPLLSRPDAPAGTRATSGGSVQSRIAKAPAKPAAFESSQPPAATAQPRAMAPATDFRRRSLIETSFGLTLIVGVALIAMALGSRGRAS